MTNTSFAKTPNGSTYVITTDNRYHALLIYRGKTFDSRLREDAAYLRDYYFTNGAACICIMFGEVIHQYLEGLECYFDPFKCYYVFFNPAVMTQATTRDSATVVHYPKAMADNAVLLYSHDAEGNQYAYHVFGERVRPIDVREDLDMISGQYYGYVMKGNVREYIYGHSIP